MTTPTTPPRVRIAPSPTGDPHVGTAYIALFNYAFAKRHGGKFVLRIEDTDQTRSTPESERAILDALRWTGLTWDEGPDVGGPFGPYRQSERTAHYRDAAARLVAAGKAYPCFCSKERLDALRAEQARAGKHQGYDRYCRNLDPAEAQKRVAAGESHVIRLAIPLDGETIVHDALRGAVKIENSGIDDQVLLKADGFPTYHLANVVDDHLMGITHVIRGEEWLISTPKHVLLYEAFGWELPVFCHLPLLRNPDKSKLSKRKNPVSINYYRRAGFLPRALLNYLALMGWTMPPVVDAQGSEQPGPEMFTVDELVEKFTLDRISLGGPVFDTVKLAWLNGKYLREKMSVDDWVTHLHRHQYSDARLREVVPLARERVEKFEDFHDYVAFIFNGALPYKLDELIPNRLTPAATATLLRDIAARYDALYAYDGESALNVLKQYCEEKNLKTKDVFMTVRVAVTGSPASPPLDQCLAVVGRDMVRHRLRDAVHQIEREIERLRGLVMPGADTRKKRAAKIEELAPKLATLRAAFGAEKSLKVDALPALIEKAGQAARLAPDEVRELLHIAVHGVLPAPSLDEVISRAGKDKLLQQLDKLAALLTPENDSD